MGFKDLIALLKYKGDGSPLSGYAFTDKDRKKSTETVKLNKEMRELNQQIKVLKVKEELMYKRAELAEIRAQFLGATKSDRDPESSNIEEMFLGKIMDLFLTKAQAKKETQTGFDPGSWEYDNVAAAPLAAVVPGAEIELSDEVIEEYITNLDPKMLKIARKMPEDSLRIIIKKQIPEINEVTLIRAIEKIKN